MLTKGIVEEVKDNLIRARIPLFNKVKGATGATPTNELQQAPICTITHFDPNLSVGDVVFVAFENNDIGSPVIIGNLYKKGISNSKGDLELHSLSVDVDTHLSSETYIGDILPREIQALRGVSSNIQSQIDNRTIDDVRNRAAFIWGDSATYCVFDGSSDEAWSLNTALVISGTQINRFNIVAPNADITNWNAKREDACICDRIPTITVANGDSGVNYTGVALYSDGKIWVYALASTFPSLSEWRSWLKSNPITIYYKGK